MWRALQIIALIINLLENADLSKLITKQQKYTLFINDYKLPTASQKTYTSMKSEFLTMQRCAIFCLNTKACNIFCFGSGTCLVTQTGNYKIFSNDTEDAISLKTYVCYTYEGMIIDNPEAIVKALNIVNVALNKPTKESSFYEERYRGSSAIDDDILMCFNSHPNIDDFPWLIIDLQKLHLVYFVNISTCTDDERCSEYFHGIEVRVGMNVETELTSINSFTRNTLCGEYSGYGETYWFLTCRPKPIPGEIITAQIVKNCSSRFCSPGFGNQLVVCRLEIYAFMP